MTFSDELFELENTVAEVLSRARDEECKAQLAALEKAGEEAKRAWSGSNLGYHADVYWEGLQPKPPFAQFSPEWGLMDRWPTHQPDSGWRVMDNAAVTEIILMQAGISDLDALKRSLALLREDLSRFKERGIALLSAALADATDPYLKRQLAQIEELQVADPGTVAISLAQGGPNWSRDSTAISQGRRVAPHQRLMAVCLSATVTENGLHSLHNAISESAVYLGRLGKFECPTGDRGPNVVIGHGRSLLWRELKDFIKDRLGLPYDEFNRVPVPGITNVARLSEMLDGSAFAFLVLTAEDEQADGRLHPRMNVVHEVGLFQGRLGFTKAIVLLEEGCEEFSNIAGLGQIRFAKGNIASVFEDVRCVLEREGLLPR
jgi:hypothetical protein